MVFSSPFFIFIFLPIVILLIGISGKKIHNIILLVSSLFFYSWGSISHLFVLLASIIINYFSGLLIDRYKHNKKIILGIAITINLLLLGYLKYFNFFMDNVNGMLNIFNSQPLPYKKVALPIGISFFTFQAISYLIDVYRKQTCAQKNFIQLSMYISLFPQLIAGPIVRYNSIEKQLKNREITIDKVSSGIQRFIFGFAKKVIIANSMATIADDIFALPMDTYDFGVAWLGIITYTFQIYFDFSGYSDMAIGLGKIFGFDFPENFNYPYISRSIKEFWRRWHISLSTWFRDYLYIPLGGNRLGNTRTLINLLLVFFCTGFWHGASWNFLFWGLLHGFFLLIERIGLDKLLDKTWNPIRVIYTLFIVIIGWIFFRIENISDAVNYLQKLFSFTIFNHPVILAEYLNRKNLFILIFATIYSFRGFRVLEESLQNIMVKKNMANLFFGVKTTTKFVLSFLFFIVSIIYLSGNTYNPFIYFRF